MQGVCKHGKSLAGPRFYRVPGLKFFFNFAQVKRQHEHRLKIIKEIILNETAQWQKRKTVYFYAKLFQLRQLKFIPNYWRPDAIARPKIVSTRQERENRMEEKEKEEEEEKSNHKNANKIKPNSNVRRTHTHTHTHTLGILSTSKSLCVFFFKITTPVYHLLQCDFELSKVTSPTHAKQKQYI